MCASLEARVSEPNRNDSIKAGEGNMLKQFLQEEEGMEMVEWALVAVLFAVASVVAWQTLGTNLNTAVDGIAEQIANPA